MEVNARRHTNQKFICFSLCAAICICNPYSNFFSILLCSLGLEFKNPNKATEMAQILHNLQEKFVPSTKIEGKHEILQRVFLDGDQLTEERARNAQLANTLADTPTERLNGLETSFADWHLGKNMLMVRNRPKWMGYGVLCGNI